MIRANVRGGRLLCSQCEAPAATIHARVVEPRATCPQHHDDGGGVWMRVNEEPLPWLGTLARDAPATVAPLLAWLGSAGLDIWAASAKVRR